MKNNIIGILLIFCCSFVNAQNKDTIVWSKDYKLTWEDFKGRPKSSSTAGAITNSGISSNYTYENGKITFRIIAKFNPKKSWVKPDDKILSTLEHEQLHFDITELYARKFKKRLSETKFKSNPEKIKKQVNRIYEEIVKELNYYQDLYDKETTKPRNEAKQKEWKEKVARELEELEEYTNPELVIDLNKKRKRKKREVTARIQNNNRTKMQIQWTDYGKVKVIDTLYQGNLSPNILNSTPSAILPKLRFKYDATGNRLEKEYTGHYKDIYLRDPQGNVMAVYRIRKDSLFLTELPMYGEKRLGVIKENKFLMKKPAGNNVSFGVINFTNFSLGKQNGKQTIYPLGKKHYEITDWLGNVRVTYTDKKSWSNGKFVLNVSSSQDYYPFGSVMEGRNLEISNYRFGFQGQEGDDEVFGKNNLWA